MAEVPVFILTNEKLAEWQKEMEQLERDIAAKQKRHAFLAGRLHAVAVLTGKEPEDREPLAAETLFDQAKPARADHKNMMGAVDKMANEAHRPISKADVRKILAEMSFPEGSLGNYFYTVIARLKAKRRITVMPNGDIWRAPAKN